MKFVKVVAIISDSQTSEILMNMDNIQVIDGDNIIMGNNTYVRITPESLTMLRIKVGADKAVRSSRN